MQVVKNPPGYAGDAKDDGSIPSLGILPLGRIYFRWEDPLEKKMPTHSSISFYISGKFHGQRGLVSCSPWGWKELEMIEHAPAICKDRLFNKWHWKIWIAISSLETHQQKAIHCWYTYVADLKIIMLNERNQEKEDKHYMIQFLWNFRKIQSNLQAQNTD